MTQNYKDTKAFGKSKQRIIAQRWKKVVITNIYDRDFEYDCRDETDYMNHLKSNPAMCENTGREF